MSFLFEKDKPCNSETSRSSQLAEKNNSVIEFIRRNSWSFVYVCIKNLSLEKSEWKLYIIIEVADGSWILLDKVLEDIDSVS